MTARKKSEAIQAVAIELRDAFPSAILPKTVVARLCCPKCGEPLVIVAGGRWATCWQPGHVGLIGGLHFRSLVAGLGGDGLPWDSHTCLQILRVAERKFRKRHRVKVAELCRYLRKATARAKNGIRKNSVD